MALFELWFFVWLFSVAGIAVLTVVHYHEEVYGPINKKVLDKKLKAPIPFRTAYRSGDYVFKILPMAIKTAFFDMPAR